MQLLAKSNGYEVIVSADGLSVELAEDNKDEGSGNTSKDTNMLRNALNKTDGGPMAVEMLAKLMEIYPIKFK